MSGREEQDRQELQAALRQQKRLRQISLVESVRLKLTDEEWHAVRDYFHRQAATEKKP